MAADVVEMPLSTLAPGEPARVQRVSDRDPQRLRYLEALGIRPGVTIQVLEALPFDGPLRLDVSGVEQMIGRPLAAIVQVAPGARAA
jgi:DtxR family Mn-dependent transcriptional regulator